jgi:hypothetical protein
VPAVVREESIVDLGPQARQLEQLQRLTNKATPEQKKIADQRYEEIGRYTWSQELREVRTAAAQHGRTDTLLALHTWTRSSWDVVIRGALRAIYMRDKLFIYYGGRHTYLTLVSPLAKAFDMEIVSYLKWHNNQ